MSSILPSNIKESFYWSKWLTFSASALVMLCAGLSYSFGIWSDAIKKQYNLSQLQVAGIGTAGNIGGYMAIFAGLLYDWLRGMNRVGPVVTLLVAVLLHFGGYFALWWAARGIFMPPYWVLVIITFFACNAQTFMETGAMVTSIRNFDTERGTVIGVLKSFLGLSGSFFTTIYVSFLEPDAASFLLLLAIIPSAIVLTCTLVINFVPYIQVEPHTKSHAFHLAFTTVIGLAAYQAVIALARNSEDFDTWDGVLMTGANVALLFPVLAIPIIFGGLRSRRLRDLTPALMDTDCPPEMQPFLENEEGDGPPVITFGENTPIQCLRSPEFWLLFTTSAILSGCGLTLLNNLAQMVEALQGAGSTSVFVSVFSITNCLGRLCAGFLPDRMLRTQDMPRTVSLVVLAVLTLTACFLNAFAQIEWFATAAGVTGFAFGGCQGIVPALASEIFGLKYLATNYSLLQLGPALCSYVQATFLAGTLYEKARQRHGDHTTCKGTDCFQLVFLINGGLAIVAVVTSVLLWHRTRGLYGKVIEVTKAERAKRGLQGEFEEARAIMRRMNAENKLMHTILVQGRSLFGKLQESMPAEESNTPEVQEAVTDLGVFIGEAKRKLEEQAELFKRMDDLPNWRRGLTG
ncbi:g10457 [Coccomyxa viridis]|uniref:G10457 protein n=1 Tax=Coccomyxa viridis TaxID=1274662 RepID=A0ABP1G5F2_9CHLO